MCWVGVEGLGIDGLGSVATCVPASETHNRILGGEEREREQVLLALRPSTPPYTGPCSGYATAEQRVVKCLSCSGGNAGPCRTTHKYS